MLARLKRLRVRSKFRTAEDADDEYKGINDVTPFDEPVLDDAKEDMCRLLDYLASHSGPSRKLVAHILTFARPPPTNLNESYTTKANTSAADSIPRGTLLDLGCGGGTMTQALSGYFERTFARDPDGEMIKMCRMVESSQEQERGQATGATSASKWDIDLGSSSDLNVPDRSIDCIVASNCAHLWDWSDPEGVYRNLASALKPHGSLIVTGARPLAGSYLDNDDDDDDDGNAGVSPRPRTCHLAQLVKNLPKELQLYVDTTRSQSGFTSLYEHLPLPQNHQQWDISSKTYHRWITDPSPSLHHRPCTGARTGSRFDATTRTDWTLSEIISWLRSLAPYKTYAQRQSPSKMQTDMALNRDLAAQVVKDACEKDGVVFSLGVRVQMQRYEAIWCIRRSSES